MIATTETRKKPMKVSERIPAPKQAAAIGVRIDYPKPFSLGLRGDSKSFRWPNHETRRVALAVDSCPCGSAVLFRVQGVDRYGITKSNPYFENGKLWVFVAGFEQAFPFAYLRVVKEIPPAVR